MLSPKETVPTPNEIVIPDCCNMGVIVRTLIFVNAVVLLFVLLRSSGVKVALYEFVTTSFIVEGGCLFSLLTLCGARSLMKKTPPLLQRMMCAVVPAGITMLISGFLLSMEGITNNFANLIAFKGMVVAGMMGIVLQHYFELRTRAFSPALMEARLQALQARIRPHFLFNSLNAVLSLIRSEPRQAETTLEDLAELFRVLMRDAREMTTLENEIRLCQQYLSIEKIRLGERLQIQWRRTNLQDEVLGNAQIPSLLLQPLLENAVHYGVEPSLVPALIQIEMSRSGDMIEISVVNPHYENIAVSSGNHMALNNIRERLTLLYDVEARLTTTVARGFFEVRLRFPYVKAN